MSIYIRAVREIRERADTAADLAHNRLDPNTDEQYVDPALLERIYAEAAQDVCAFLADGITTEGMKLVLRAGRLEGDDLPADDADLGYPPVNARDT